MAKSALVIALSSIQQPFIVWYMKTLSCTSLDYCVCRLQFCVNIRWPSSVDDWLAQYNEDGQIYMRECLWLSKRKWATGTTIADKYPDGCQSNGSQAMTIYTPVPPAISKLLVNGMVSGQVGASLQIGLFTSTCKVCQSKHALYLAIIGNLTINRQDLTSPNLPRTKFKQGGAHAIYYTAQYAL